MIISHFVTDVAARNAVAARCPVRVFVLKVAHDAADPALSARQEITEQPKTGEILQHCDFFRDLPFQRVSIQPQSVQTC